MMRVLSTLVVNAGLLSALTAITADAQLLLQARQGNTWVGRLNLSELVTMNFRVRPEGQAEVGVDALWEMVYGFPVGRGNPEIRATQRFKLASTVSDFVRFRIAPEQLPESTPSKFYVRVRSGRSVSSWLPVTVEVPGRATATLPKAPPSPRQTAGVLNPNPPLQTAGVTNPPLQTAGVANPNPPLWIKLTKIICHSVSSDGSASDEVYAVVAAVALNHNKLWTSSAMTNVTRVYEHMDPGDRISLSHDVWGPPFGAALPLREPTDAILYYDLNEHDSGRPGLAQPVTLMSLKKAVANFNPGKYYGQMAQEVSTAIRAGMSDVDGPIGIGSDDNIGDGFLKFFEPELDSARAGKIVKKEITLGAAGKGVYTMRFQMGRAGTSPEAW